MATWTVMAGTHQFTTGDEQSAAAAAEALSSYGFALVTANPSRLGPGWMVTAWDEGPYPADAVGHRQIEAVGHAAPAVVRPYGGLAEGGTRGEPAMLLTLQGAARSAAVAADCLLADLLADAEAADLAGAEPQHGPWALDVHRAVGEQVGDLITRWDAEPPRVRLVLACLAALFPAAGRPLAPDIAALAGDGDTSQGAFLSLAHALVSGDEARAEELAAGIVAWDDSSEPAWLAAPGVTVAVRAGHVLADGVLRVL